MPRDLIELPSGLKGEVRSPTAQEVLEWSTSSRATQSDVVARILKATWCGTQDPGPYKCGPNEPDFDMDGYLTIDGAVQWVRIRVLGFGPLARFKTQCLNPSCELSKELTDAPPADLSRIPIVAMPDWARKQFKEGAPFETTVAGKKVVFRLLTRSLEKQAEKELGAIPQGGGNAEREKALAIWNRNLAAMLLTQVEGVDAQDHREWVGALDGGDFDDLNYAIEEASGKIDRSVDVQCKRCAVVRRIDPPPFDPEWFRKVRLPKASPSPTSAA